MSYKIVIDSCGELLDQWKQDEHFQSVPLTLTVGSENIIDDSTFDQADFLQKVAACRSALSQHAHLRRVTGKHLTVKRSMYIV